MTYLEGNMAVSKAAITPWIGNLSTIRKVRTFIMLFSVRQDTSTLSSAAFTILEKASSNFCKLVPSISHANILNVWERENGPESADHVTTT